MEEEEEHAALTKEAISSAAPFFSSSPHFPCHLSLPVLGNQRYHEDPGMQRLLLHM